MNSLDYSLRNTARKTKPMNRFQGNPILHPIAKNPWESKLVFNAAAILLKKRIHILYRAIGNDGISRIGYAATTDGYTIIDRLLTPVFEPNGEVEHSGCEDPRLSIFGEKIVMAYTALSEHDHGQLPQISLTSIATEDFLNKSWDWEQRSLPFRGIRNKDAMLFPRKIKGKYVMFHRIEPDICVAYSDDLDRWYDIRSVFGPRIKSWDNWKVGAAGPPIEINEGWLMVYHGVSFEKVYSLGVALLDKNEPETVLHRSEIPILFPVEDYERFGKVPNVVFSCGNIVVDDKVLVYYGACDSVLCVATYDIAELLPHK
jgi:predicted GH43/DUF377 family glycosyl hydrolase